MFYAFFWVNHWLQMIHVLSEDISLISGIIWYQVQSWASQEALVVQNLPASAGDVGWTPGSGRSPGEGHGNPLQYSCLENPMDRGAWRVHTVHRAAKSCTWWSDLAHQVHGFQIYMHWLVQLVQLAAWRLLSYKWLFKLLQVPQPSPTITWGPLDQRSSICG